MCISESECELCMRERMRERDYLTSDTRRSRGLLGQPLKSRCDRGPCVPAKVKVAEGEGRTAQAITTHSEPLTFAI